MKVVFEACLQGAGCLRTDDDGSCVIKLTTDGSQLPNTIKLNTMLRKPIKVTIEEQS